MNTATLIQVIIAGVLIAVLGLLAYQRKRGDAGDQIANGCLFWLIVFAVLVDALVMFVRSLRVRM